MPKRLPSPLEDVLHSARVGNFSAHSAATARDSRTNRSPSLYQPVSPQDTSREAAGLPPRTAARKPSPVPSNEREWALVHRLVPSAADVAPYVRECFHAAKVEDVPRALGSAELLEDVLERVKRIDPEAKRIDRAALAAELHRATDSIGPVDEEAVAAHTTSARAGLARFWVDRLLLAHRISGNSSLFLNESFEPKVDAPAWQSVREDLAQALLANFALSAESLTALGGLLYSTVHRCLAQHEHDAESHPHAIRFPHQLVLDLDAQSRIYSTAFHPY